MWTPGVGHVTVTGLVKPQMEERRPLGLPSQGDMSSLLSSRAVGGFGQQPGSLHLSFLLSTHTILTLTPAFLNRKQDPRKTLMLLVSMPLAMAMPMLDISN